MRIAVSGGRGFIGSHLVAELRLQGHEVIVIDTTPGGPEAEVPVDVLDLPAFCAAVTGCHVLVHLAGPVLEHAERDPHRAMHLQMLGTLNAVEACRAAGVRHIVLASSFYVYAGLPAGQTVDEDTRIVPDAVGPFAAAKLAAEHLVRGAASAADVTYLILRFGSAFGHGGGSNIVRSFVEAAIRGGPIEVFGDGSRLNQLTLVDDIVKGCGLALNCRDEVLNLVSPETCTTMQLAETIAKWFGCAVQCRHDRQQRQPFPYIDPRKAIGLGWRPTQLLTALRQSVSASTTW
jgi:UDP-glucose 4-epimerase